MGYWFGDYHDHLHRNRLIYRVISRQDFKNIALDGVCFFYTRDMLGWMGHFQDTHEGYKKNVRKYHPLGDRKLKKFALYMLPVGFVALVLSIFSVSYGAGLLIGVLASGISFCLQGYSLEGMLKKKSTRVAYMALYGARVVCALLCIYLGLLSGAHPIGIFAGITLALGIQVLICMKELKKDACELAGMS
jgi:hypothetical protein